MLVDWPKNDEIMEDFANRIVKSFIVFSSSNVIRKLKLRKMRWMGHVAGTEEMSSACKILAKIVKRRNLGGKVILKRMLVKWHVLVDWIRLPCDEDLLQALVNTLMNLHAH
jgi:hypothetical protein